MIYYSIVNNKTTAKADLEKALSEFTKTVVASTDRSVDVALLAARCEAIADACGEYAKLYKAEDVDATQKLDEQFGLDLDKTLFSEKYDTVEELAKFASDIADNLDRALKKKGDNA